VGELLGAEPGGEGGLRELGPEPRVLQLVQEVEGLRVQQELAVLGTLPVLEVIEVVEEGGLVENSEGSLVGGCIEFDVHAGDHEPGGAG